MNYVYDGSFFGFLSVVFDAYHDGLGQVESIHPDTGILAFGEERRIVMDMTKAQRILDALQEQCGGRTCHFLYYAFMAEKMGREATLLAYIRQAFLQKNDFLRHLNEHIPWKVRQWAMQTGNERHKLLGLLRFRELSDGMLYGLVAPTCCVVPLMAPHFVKRLAGEHWIIHDTKRNFGVYFDGQDLALVEIPQTATTIEVSQTEEVFAAFWQHYYRTIAIKERTNHALRRSYMPKKYWKYLIEME